MPLLKSYLRIIYSMTILAAGLSACDTEAPVYDEVTSNLALSISEVFPQDEVTAPVPQLNIRTEANYNCINYRLVTQKTGNDGDLRIEVLGTDIGDICLTAIGPATTHMNLNSNTKRIALSMNGSTDQYLVSVDDQKVSITPLNTGFSAFDYADYYRYPENSFAFLCGTSVEDAASCDRFEQVLSDNLDLEAFTFPSQGKIPYPDSASGHWYNAPAKFYRYQNASDLETAGALLKSFYEAELADKQGAGLSIWGWNNMRFRNDRRLN